ncbi:unnamed protein product [Cladocopium goreaui]|uniref:Uncharacterized protein n=1 Tax=Cladocopium goreaui TaxID=2562237 RepID=A0A9P1CQN5_9DINO|nr:unnamed protein product [Cladocopium goreaui]
MHSRRGDPSRRNNAPRSPTSPADAELGDLEAEKDEPRKRQRWSVRTWILSLAACLLLLFLFSIKVEFGFGYVFAQCVFKAYHPLDEYRKSGDIYPSVSAILEKAPKGWGSVDFPTDKASLHNYTQIYDVLLAPYQHTARNVLEIGIKKGGSMKLWREFFDASAFIYGMDIDPSCPTFTRDAHMKSIILDTNVRKDVEAAVGDLRFDIIVDDGCHTNTCIWNSWKALFPSLEPHGVYLVEDYPKFRVESSWADGKIAMDFHG